MTSTPPTTRKHISNVEISFGYSSSQYYQLAIELCHSFPSYQTSGEGKQTRHSVMHPITEGEKLEELYNIVGNWKSCKLLIDGKLSTRSDLVGGGISCYRMQQKAYDPKQYCYGERERDYNIWGCQALRMPLQDYADWLSYGRMDKNGVWHVDKEKIRYHLEQGLHTWGNCPVLDRQRVLERLEKFPSTINPKMDSRWEYITESDYSGNRWKEVAVGIKPRPQKKDFYVVSDFSVKSPPSTIEVTIPIPQAKSTKKVPKSKKQSIGKQIGKTLLTLFIITVVIFGFFIYLVTR